MSGTSGAKGHTRRCGGNSRQGRLVASRPPPRPGPTLPPLPAVGTPSGWAVSPGPGSRPRSGPSCSHRSVGEGGTGRHDALSAHRCPSVPTVGCPAAALASAARQLLPRQRGAARLLLADIDGQAGPHRPATRRGHSSAQSPGARPPTAGTNNHRSLSSISLGGLFSIISLHERIHEEKGKNAPLTPTITGGLIS